MRTKSIFSPLKTSVIAVLICVAISGCDAGLSSQLKALNSDDPEQRQAAAREFADAQEPIPPKAVAALIDHVGDPDEDVARLSVHALTKQREPSDATIGALRQAVRDDREPVRLNAAFALADLQQSDEATVEVLMTAAEDGLNASAVRQLGLTGSTGKPALPLLSRLLLKSPEPLVRSQAVLAIGKIGPDQAARAALKQAAASDRVEIVRTRAEALLESSAE
ncbi:HEAT repeat domain-containing protein [Stratiformator vulcanicus]|nr:HEAT repeat domain-containing protein [Stratiformator vulcanicus]